MEEAVEAMRKLLPSARFLAMLAVFAIGENGGNKMSSDEMTPCDCESQIDELEAFIKMYKRREAHTQGLKRDVSRNVGRGIRRARAQVRALKQAAREKRLAEAAQRSDSD